MFKSKYGLISAVIVIAFTIGAYMWSTSSVSTSINEIAQKRLKKSDYLMRRNEQENMMRSKALVSSASLEIGQVYKQYVQLQKKLGTEMEKQMELISKDGETPAFLAVISKPRGRMKRSTIHWLAVNGQQVSPELVNGWINPGLIKKLLKKYPAKTKKAASSKQEKVTDQTKKETDKNKDENTDSKKIDIPLIFPGESAGKYVSAPFEKKGYQVDDLGVVLGVHLVDRVQKQKDGSLIPISNGILLAGYESGSGVNKNLAAQLLLRTGRQKSLFQLSEQIAKLRKKLFQGLNAVYNGQKYNLQGRKPHLVAITDAQGNVITRDRNDKNLSGYNYLNNKNGKLLLIQEAVKQKNVVYDVVEHEIINMFKPKKRPAEIYQVASIPFFDNQGKVSGTVNIAWPFDVRVFQINMVSRIKFSFFYKNIAFYTNFQGTNAIKEFEKTFKGRFEAVDISPLCEKNNKTPAGQKEKKTDKQAQTKDTDTEKNINVEKFDFAGENYLGTYYRFQNLALNEAKYGYIVMVSLEDMHKPFNGIGFLVIVFGIITLILVFLVEYLVFNYFYSKIDALDEGIQEIAAGDLDFVFGRISPEIEGVANSLNEMLNVLVGREAMDEETGETPDKEGINLLYMGAKPEMPYLEDDEIVVAYVKMEYNDYWNQLYSKFKEIWKKSGRSEPVPSQDLFEQRIKLYERMVLHQIECEMVFFDIKLKDNGIEVVPLPLT